MKSALSMTLCFASLLLPATLCLAAQQGPAQSSPVAAKVRFSFEWSQGIPWQRYSIEVTSDGRSHFEGQPHPEDNGDSDPWQQDFTMSAANRQKIFDLAQKLNYFRGNFDAHIKHIAQTGTKTLQYESPELRGASSYNWSQNPQVQELTRLFQGIATTIDFGRTLAFHYRFDKLGMDQQLKELEDLEAGHELQELEIIAPMLRKIAGDPNLMNISRQSAQRLLRTLDEPEAAAQNPAQP
ncbi:MAG TPA: hypothetical protein VL240_06990 [Candidatus Binatia bacterium]|nr:hypothetical protein [Candidatus Binatia bacterium]